MTATDTNAQATELAVTKPTPQFQAFYVETEKQAPVIEPVLPPHIDINLFKRSLYNAVQAKPDLLNADRGQLWRCVMQAAEDGLLPDGKEGAIVPRKGGLVWQPMIAGIRKKARQSGELTDWRVEAVYENDFFERELGDTPFIRHQPPELGAPRGALIGAYSIATLKKGDLNREVMDLTEITRIRDRSDAWKAYKAGKISETPWHSDFDEMAKKTVARRHSKQLLLSREMQTVVNRDEALFNDVPQEDAPSRLRGPAMASGIVGRLRGPDGNGFDRDKVIDHLDGDPTNNELGNLKLAEVPHDPETGEITAPKKGGRPIGSKNKPKDTPVAQSVEQAASASSADVGSIPAGGSVVADVNAISAALEAETPQGRPSEPVETAPAQKTVEAPKPASEAPSGPSVAAWTKDDYRIFSQKYLMRSESPPSLVKQSDKFFQDFPRRKPNTVTEALHAAHVSRTTGLDSLEEFDRKIGDILKGIA